MKVFEFSIMAAKRVCTANLAEFDFRYNRRAVLGFTDQMRESIMAGIAGSTSPIGGLVKPVTP